MPILITGGAGFIGSHLARALLERDEIVIALDNFNDYYDPAIKRRNAAELALYPRFRLVEGDIRKPKVLRKLFARHKIRRVVHLAAMPGVRRSIYEPTLYTEVNLNGTLHVLEAARVHGVEQFVLASTSSVYGKTKRLPFEESDPCDRPLAAYPASKRAAELIAHTYHHLHGMNITVLRFFNVYGPAGRPDMMPMRIMQALVAGTSVPIFGEGKLERDWTYIDDTVQGVIAALERPLGYEIINLGVGAPISLRAFIERLEELSGLRLRTENAPTPPSDPPITYCDNHKARELLGFAPQVRVEEGLARTWEWFCRWREEQARP